MKIQIVAPHPAGAVTGNRITAERWEKILLQLGNQVRVSIKYEATDPDLLVAIHARRSHESAKNFRMDFPQRPLVVALTGTDLYRDIKDNSQAAESLELADFLIVLQQKALLELEERLHPKVHVIYQSASPPRTPLPRPDDQFRVCVLGHLRPEKDPLLTARAVRGLPESSRIHILQIGKALRSDVRKLAEEEQRENSRFRWLQELPHEEAKNHLASSHLLSLTSLMEGSSNALSEALTCGVPVVATRIPGIQGTLGDDYPGFFEPRDSDALRELLLRAEMDPGFLADLKRSCRKVAKLVAVEAEVDAWRRLLAEAGSFDKKVNVHPSGADS